MTILHLEKRRQRRPTGDDRNHFWKNYHTTLVALLAILVALPA